MKRMLLAVLISIPVIFAVGCGSDKASPAAPKETSSINTFSTDLEGWTAHVSSIDFGLARWINANGGSAELDGVSDNDPGPNAWIEKSIALPSNVTSLHYKASAHDGGPGTGFLRVLLKDESDVVHTLVDWEMFETGDPGYDFVPRSASLSAYAGQTVTISFELDDKDGGGNNQVVVDDVDIRHSN